MSVEQAAVLAAAVVGARHLWLRGRISSLTRRRDNADRQLNQTLRRWW